MGESLYGCEVESVREIVRMGRITRIPGSPAFVRGITNLRGDVLNVIDVGMRFDPGRTPIEVGRGRLVVVQHGERRAGLAVDEVLEVREIETDPGPEKIAEKEASELVRPMGHLDGRIVLFLDVSALLQQALI